MKVLWLCNIALPEASLLMNEKPVSFGGWFASVAAHVKKMERIKLSVAFPQSGVRHVLFLEGDKTGYYVFPPLRDNQPNNIQANGYLTYILDQTKPDLVHIFGTEYAHSLAMVNACISKDITPVISIQGLVSIIAQHYLSGLPETVKNRFTLRDLIKQDNITQQQKKFVKSGILEIEALQKVKHVIGRTTWDRACIYQINPAAEYHFCNETLRDEFSQHRWDINHCEKHSIFVSQGSYPVKGMHFVLKAMPLILKRFPDTKLYVGGYDPIGTASLYDRLKISSYGKYLKELIRKYNLHKNVLFTGLLDTKQMCERYLRSHVFVSASVVENESNSLSEAKNIGVPSVASYVGGVTDRIEHGQDGFFYPYDEPYMLAHYVCAIFGSSELAVSVSEKASTNARGINNPNTNIKTLLNIYEQISGSKD